MGKLSREQEEMLSQIDAMLVMIDRYGSLAGLFDNFKVNLSPLRYSSTL
jgi:hypothetical protein